MLYRVFNPIVVFLILLNWSAGAQSLDADLKFLSDQVQVKPVKVEKYKLGQTETNEIKMGVQVFFLFYKKFLSSQDNQNCSFSPSCSTYCLHSIQKKGVIKGLMSSFDRLSRCNYLSPENYEVDFASGRLLDPVEEP